MRVGLGKSWTINGAQIRATDPPIPLFAPLEAGMDPDRGGKHVGTAGRRS